MSELDALKEAEAALELAKAAIISAESHVGGAAPAEPVKPSEEVAGSVYLGHVGEPAVEGKDF